MVRRTPDIYRVLPVHRGVQSLFAAFDRAIDPASAAYQGFLKQMSDQALARRLASAVGIEYLPTMAKATRA